MAHLSICERINGSDEPAVGYMQTMKFALDKKNCVEIECHDDNGDGYLVQIPVTAWSEFVRKCQKLSISSGATK